MGTTSFTFFNNDIDGHAVRNADTLKHHLEKLGVGAGPSAAAKGSRPTVMFSDA